MSDTTPAASIGAPATENDIRLSLTDIENALKIIDYAADAGAFRGWEVINQVLMVRQHLAAFLAAAQAAQAAAEAEAAPATTDDAAPAADAPAADAPAAN
jgi:hypothetical protein